MNLIIDAGNTQIKWALFGNGGILLKGNVKQWGDLTDGEWTSQVGQIDHCMISSTRKTDEGFKTWLREHGVEVWFMRHDLVFPFIVDYHTPETIGLDRIAGIAGARARFPGDSVLVIDLGTAITYDLLTANGVFVGGNISPGMRIRFESLNRFTDNLPLVSPDEEVPELGKSTLEAIRSGVQTGILFEIIAYINSLKNKYNELRVILTGGDAEFFVKKLKKTIFVDPNLVLNGLNHILEYQLQVRSGRN